MSNPTLTEDDLVKIFSNKKKVNWLDFTMMLLNKVMIFIMILLIVYVTINFPAFKDKFSYWYNNDFQNNEPKDNNQITNNIPEETPKEEGPKIDLPKVEPNYVYIPSINVSAPTTWRVNNLPREVSDNLEKGVIHINGTALPGEKGNIYITGHSSNYVWAKGDYNSIFALLGKVVVGDMAYVNFQDQTYAYEVIDRKIVLPTDMSVMNATNKSVLTLVTCWPIGTSLKRLVVTAEQIYPDPKLNKTSSSNSELSNLPGGR